MTRCPRQHSWAPLGSAVLSLLRGGSDPSKAAQLEWPQGGTLLAGTFPLESATWQGPVGRAVLLLCGLRPSLGSGNLGAWLSPPGALPCLAGPSLEQHS